MSESRDDHYFVHGGRRWRKTDPGIPTSLKSELVAELMAARRAVRTALGRQDEIALALARRRVNDAKVALGERGAYWWLDIQPEPVRMRLAATIKALLRYRDPDRSICPSEAARVAAGARWRTVMAEARKVALQLQAEGWLQIVQRGKPASLPLKGPIRLKRAQH